VGINVQWDTEGEALRFLETYRLPYPVVRDASGAAARTYGLEGTPTTYVIDRGGRVASASVGAIEPEALGRLLESTLARS
jgi:cytochrome c biogenesis protein CcmG/thiol:disulfide interchange protein DsbE